MQENSLNSPIKMKRSWKYFRNRREYFWIEALCGKSRISVDTTITMRNETVPRVSSYIYELGSFEGGEYERKSTGGCLNTSTWSFSASVLPPPIFRILFLGHEVVYNFFTILRKPWLFDNFLRSICNFLIFLDQQKPRNWGWITHLKL